MSSSTESDVSSAEPDRELADLPPPRRPFRRLTLFVMGVTAALALWLAYSLRGDLAYALSGGAPRDIGSLDKLGSDGIPANSWVRGEGSLSTADVVRYFRPLDRDAHRLARVDGNPRLWVELRVPRDADGEHFVAPGSFVGRLVPASEAGLRYGALASAVAEAGKPPLPEDSWLLLDGESPQTTRWVIGLMVVLFGFAAFNLVGLVRLSRLVRDA